MEKKYKVTGIGNAILDVTSRVQENFLINNNLEKNFMSLIDKNTSDKLYSFLTKKTLSAGGSVANSIIALSKLKLGTSFIGKINNDEMGKNFTNDMRLNKVSFKPNFSENKYSTGKCICLITPDGERTMCTNLGVSKLIKKEDLNIEVLRNTEILYLEGYVLDNEKSLDVFSTAINIVKKNKGKIALTLSDPNCVKRNINSFNSIINNQIDYLFCNEEELKIFSGSKNTNEGMKKCPKLIKNIICTLGEKGANIYNHSEIKFISTKKIKPVDTTAAGDYFAAGFLFGILSSKSLSESAKIGNILAKEIILSFGSRLKEISWDKLRKEVLYF